tara:strand:- start:83 stop:421 length:339 start_codon:yes stop_codon:yes gene_type:complete
MGKKSKKTPGGGSGVDLLDKQQDKQKLQKPSKYNVVFHNDDYTPMQLVVIILMTFFRKDVDSAWGVTMDIHEKGRGIAGGPYPKGIAETKAEKTVSYARQAGYPLKATYEKA